VQKAKNQAKKKVDFKPPNWDARLLENVLKFMSYFYEKTNLASWCIIINLKISYTRFFINNP